MKRCIIPILFLMLLAAMPALSAIKVVSARGETAFMDKGKLQPLKAGTELREGVAVITGVNSQVVIDVDGHRMTIGSLTTMKISRASAADTRVALKRGSVVSEVKKIKGVKTSFKVATPVATSSVRGTTYSVSYGPAMGMRVEVEKGVIVVESPRGGTRTLSGSLVYVQARGDRVPQSLTGSLRESSQTKITDQYVTGDEAALNEQYSGEFRETQQAAESVDVETARTSASVEILFE